MLLALLIGITGLLAAVLCNDIVCLAMAPVLVEGCERRKLNPVPFLLALACASNVGSAATLIGNPQNILIGQKLQMPFAGYLLMALVPSILGLAAIWWVIRHLARGQWHKDMAPTPAEAPPFNVWQTGKGVTVLAALMAVFLLTTWPRELCALAAGGLLMTSRRLASRRILALIDWQLLVLFVGLFVINDVLASSGTLGELFAILQSGGLDLGQPVPLFLTTAVLSNLVSNVPAVMLLLPVASHPLAGCQPGALQHARGESPPSSAASPISS
jgi:Na+/H+ antiporter NhaD/arsenite permease-like protein